LLYGGVVRLWVASYTIGIKKTEGLEVPVISVGNIVAGGTGKTGFVICLVSILQGLKKKACVLTRGYGGRRHGVVNTPGDLMDWGDEAVLLARQLPATPVITGRDRLKTGRLALDKFNPDVVVLDDGFQYLRLQRNLNILLVDATDPFGGKHFPPCGLLREPLSNVSRADMIVLTRTNQIGEIGPLKRKLERLNPQAPLIRATYEPLSLRDHVTGEKSGLEILKEKEVVAFSSIGNPGSFEKELELCGAVVVRSFRFPDHYLYDSADLEYLRAQSETRTLTTTQKDAVKLPLDFSCKVLEVRMVITEGEEVLERCVRAIL
jgi:tetraacyldisaccharide 4'-kinase